MKRHECPFEETILAASRTGEWSDALRAHAANCRACEETALVADYLCESSDAAGLEVRLPDAGFVWWRAEIAAKSREMERALRPIAWARRISFGVCAAIAAVVLVGFWPQLGGMLQSLAPSPTSAASGHANVMLLVAAVFLMTLIPLVFGLYAAWSEN